MLLLGSISKSWHENMALLPGSVLVLIHDIVKDRLVQDRCVACYPPAAFALTFIPGQHWDWPKTFPKFKSVYTRVERVLADSKCACTF